MNNPILNIDVNGDSTRVYNESGAFQFTINDNLPNQDHFFSEDAINSMAADCCSDANEYGESARSNSLFFAGENTRSDIEGITEKSNAEGLERGFALVPGSDRELKAIDITDGAESRTSNSFDMGGALKNSGLKGVVGSGHTHPGVNAGDSDVMMPSLPRSLNNMKDFKCFVRNNRSGGLGANPTMIGSSKGITIYSTGHRAASYTEKHTFKKGLKRVRIDYNGNKIK